jgi:hypothetical protein
MKHDLFDEALVREYLLGRLENNKELEERLSLEICVNDELSEMAESVEDEIIEEVLDGTLDLADKNAVDGYFLRSPERKEKLRFARLFRQYVEHEHDLVGTRNETPESTRVHPETIHSWSSRLGRSPIRTYGELAALALLIVVGLFYISGIRKSQAGLEKQLAQAQEQFAQSREQFATLAKSTLVTQGSLTAFTLVPDQRRGDVDSILEIAIQPSTRRVVVDIALQSHSPGPYDVVLEAQGKSEPIWTARLLPLISASGDARLVFDVPVQGLASGVYSFVVSSSLPGSGNPSHYSFRITQAK